MWLESMCGCQSVCVCWTAGEAGSFAPGTADSLLTVPSPPSAQNQAEGPRQPSPLVSGLDLEKTPRGGRTVLNPGE